MPSKFVPNFKPSRNGLHFVNSWPHEPDIIVNVAGLGNVGIGDASNGLCGGMVFTVRDVYQAGQPPIPDTKPPAEGSPLFKYIVNRLFASFSIPGGVLKYYDWMNTPTHDTGVWFAIRHGVSWHTIVEEWPKIKGDIDGGQPSPLGLVTTYSLNPGDLGKNHQVLAYGYDLDGSNNLTLHLYDPNTDPAHADNVALSLNLGNPSHTTAISHNVAIGYPVRGFFRVDYGFCNPSALEAPVPAPPPTPLLSTSVTPRPVPTGVPVQVTVHAQDARSRAPVGGTVLIGGVTVGHTDAPFTYTFRPRTMPRRGRTGWDAVLVYPAGEVTAPGYAAARLDFGFARAGG